MHICKTVTIDRVWTILEKMKYTDSYSSITINYMTTEFSKFRQAICIEELYKFENRRPNVISTYERNLNGSVNQ